jgi:hypothetical protein
MASKNIRASAFTGFNKAYVLCRQSAACSGTVSCCTAFRLFSVLFPLPFFPAFPALLLTIVIPVWLTQLNYPG